MPVDLSNPRRDRGPRHRRDRRRGHAAGRPGGRLVSVAVAALGWLALGLVIASCAASQGLQRKEGPAYEAETASWIAAIRALGGPGMWVVVRGYHTGDDVVAVATNATFSHAAVLDLERLKVIEAIGDGVQVKPLLALLRESHRVQLVRPAAWTAELGAEAVKRARSQVGRGYDFLGILGAPDKKRWYCSELAAWSMGIPVDQRGPWRVLHPQDMQRKGTLLFDSAARDGRQDAAPTAASPEPAPAPPVAATTTEVKP